jgi:hypothetical protein
MGLLPDEGTGSKIVNCVFAIALVLGILILISVLGCYVHPYQHYEFSTNMTGYHVAQELGPMQSEAYLRSQPVFYNSTIDGRLHLENIMLPCDSSTPFGFEYSWTDKNNMTCGYIVWVAQDDSWVGNDDETRIRNW